MRNVWSRLAWAVPTLLFVSLLVFILLDLAPGDPARTIAGPDASEELLDEIRAGLDLDRPLLVRYADWVGDAVQGDLGRSLVGNQPVTSTVMDALPVSMSLVFLAVVFSLVLAAIIGAAPTLWRNPIVDRVCTTISAASVALPSMVVALLLARTFAVDRDWFPAVGYVGLHDPVAWFHHLVLPALSLAGVTTGELARQLRGSLHDVMSSDYVLAAKARGLSHGRIVAKHAVKNAAIPVVTVLGVRTGQLLAGTVIVEQIFLIDGLGRLTIDAVISRDVPIVLGVVVVATAIVLLLNLLVDLAYPYFNPKLARS